VLLLLLVAAPVLVAVLVFDSKPTVAEGEPLTPESARQAREMALRLKREFLGTTQPAGAVVEEQELNGLLGLAARAMPRVRGRIVVTEGGVHGALSLEVLPANPFGSYVNLSAVVRPSVEGLDVERLRIGDLRLPWVVARPFVRLALDLALGWGNGAALLDMIRGVAMDDDRVVVAFHEVPDYQRRVTDARDHVRQLRDDVAVVGDPALVRVYYTAILQLADEVASGRFVSLAEYMGPLFDKARARSQAGNAVEENRAAIMALAIYFGSYRFEMLTGPVKPPEAESHVSRAWSTTLAGRRDLRLHFIYSAAIKLASDSGVSFAIGEFKELLDSGPGGSGFSFADLAADRAGILFAEEATRDEPSARRLQELLATDPDERVFFPPLTNLPEGLEEKRFAADFKNIDAPEYRSMLLEIDRRLAGLPLHP